MKCSQSWHSYEESQGLFEEIVTLLHKQNVNKVNAFHSDMTDDNSW